MKERIIDKIKNGQEPRFLPATESIAHERLNHFRGTVKEFQKKFPEVLGATVFGSMIKGEQAKETSDIDSFIYIDKDKIPKDIGIDNPHDLEQLYLSKFKNKLNLPEDDFQKYYHDLRTKVLSNDILENSIADFIDYEESHEEYKKMVESTYSFEMLEEEKNKLLKAEPPLAYINQPISGMFHARVGTGIEKYRQLFLEKINSLSDKNMAEKIWRSVHFNLKTYEQREDENKTIKIPETLNEALQVYHPDLYKSTKKHETESRINEEKLKIEASFNK